MKDKTFVLGVTLLMIRLLTPQTTMSQEAPKTNFIVEKHMYNVECDGIKSFCDTMIDYSIDYFNTPIWYKMSIAGELNELSILCTSVQYFDSTYVHKNSQWIENSIFVFSHFSYGFFCYRGYLFEFDLSIPVDYATSADKLFSKSDSVMTLIPWDSSAKPEWLSKKNKFPHYCQLSGTLNLKENKVFVEKKISTFDIGKKIKKRKTAKHHN